MMKSKVLKPLNRLCPDVYPSEKKRVVAKYVTKKGLHQCQVIWSLSKVNQSHLVKYKRFYFNLLFISPLPSALALSLHNRDVVSLCLSRVRKFL